MCVCICIMLSSLRHTMPSTATTTTPTTPTTTITTTNTDVSAKAAESNPYDTPPPYPGYNQPVVGGSMNYKSKYIREKNVCGCFWKYLNTYSYINYID